MPSKTSFWGTFFARRKPLDYGKDLAGGIITALVSIPISMGYAQIAGLPMQYGLYGSILPILLFGLLTTSRDFVFGVDAAPAALIGTAIASAGITAGSEQAMAAVPMIALFTAFWLLLFCFLRAGRIVQYISEPVMAGFVSGICCTIILMQIPKLFGGQPGSGEAPELIRHLIEQLPSFNPAAFSLGLSVIVLILLFRRLVPRLPMSVILMAAGAVMTVLLPVRDWGVKLLPHVDNGFPGFAMTVPELDYDQFIGLAFASLSIAAVILSESLLASGANARKDGYRLDANRELLGYAAANLASAVSGCCSVNGSVSRTGIVRQFGVKSQWMSVFAAAAMLCVVCFGTGFIELLPVPVLTAIVISALMGACEFQTAVRLLKTDKTEFYIFAAAFFGVLIFGTVYGVMIGVALSFFAVIKRAVRPPKTFMGVIPGRSGFYPLDRNSLALPVRHTLIYRFGGNLFFANIDSLQEDIERAMTEDTRTVILCAGAVGSIDLAAAERLVMLYRHCKERQVRFYMTEHIGAVNDLLRKYGASELIENGAVRMTTELALRDAGVRKPYPLAVPSGQEEALRNDRVTLGRQTELEWALGRDAESFKQQVTEEIYRSLKNREELTVDIVEQAENLTRWGRFSLFDEDELLDRLEARLLDRAVRHPDQAERIENILEKRRQLVEKKLAEMTPEALEQRRRKRLAYLRELYEQSPEKYAEQLRKRREHLDALRRMNPALAERYDGVYQEMLLVAKSGKEQKLSEES